MTGRNVKAAQIDPRGPRVAAALSTVVLAVVLLTENPYVLGFQALVFGLGAVIGPARSPYGLVFRYLVRPRLSAPDELEDEAPPRFAQAVGFVFAAVALAGFLAGLTMLGLLATAIALLAAFANAVFGLCIGCEVYLLLARLRRRPAGAQ